MTAVLDYEGDGIVRLMSMAEEDWTEQELKDALGHAIMLELATIPPYATALWSITNQDNTAGVYQTIREIIFDEMSHFGLVCNMLTSIGGTVVLTNPLTVPKYPGELPGKVNPGLKVYLSGLTRESAKLFSDIEKPENPLAFALDGNTIGAFYQRIAKVFPKYAHLLTGQRQVTFPLGAKHGAGNDIVPMNTIDDVLKAIKIIQSQGEGTECSPENPFPGDPGELAHYYAFKEIAEGKRLVLNPKTMRWEFTGDPVPLPPTSPVARVPKGGWANDKPNQPDPDTARLLHTFNQQYSNMLRALEEAWSDLGSASIGTAIGLMGAMRGTAQQINGVKLPANPRFAYGPEWLFVQQ
ncbi:ferritin-like protein [Kitasatospora aureofaciens]|uniref:ferritin-like domain-containing protein n=1 Tax=Kitasatospora aureofaciens TaxID=1894 RepID=UPI001C476E89|nr:ferritin-like protein [Kitasatospora aureofaciens]MBV6700038.1 ferritin-like protein [Kitasatospora aureofaciens]